MLLCAQEDRRIRLENIDRMVQVLHAVADVGFAQALEALDFA